MTFELITVASTTALLANIVTVFGENVDGVLIVVGGLAGIVLAFWIARGILGFFSRRGTRQ